MGIRTEVDPRVIATCVVVADGREESRAEGKFSVALHAGVVSAGDIRADLVGAGRKSQVTHAGATYRSGGDEGPGGLALG